MRSGALARYFESDGIDRVVEDLVRFARPHHQDRGRSLRLAAGEDVAHTGRAVEEVAGTHRTLFALHDQRALAAEDEERFLRVLAVVHARALTGAQHVHVHTELGEARGVRGVALEAAPDAGATGSRPVRVREVQHEPAGPGGPQADVRALHGCGTGFGQGVVRVRRVAHRDIIATGRRAGDLDPPEGGTGSLVLDRTGDLDLPMGGTVG
ncbi:MAG: hypothetical protein R3F34_00440 [Planctomycetota bacterium]